MPFPEEQLDSSVGYFVGEPGTTLQGGEWTITRKLGWGPCSTTWLASNSKNPDKIDILAIKIFTVAATQDGVAANERDLLAGPLQKEFQVLPSLVSSFYEETAEGKHLALVLNVLGPSVESFRVASGGSLPLPAVKKIVSDVLECLATIHDKKIVHTAVSAENILFAGIQQVPDILAAVAKSPSVKAEDVTDAQGNVFKVVKSQPFREVTKSDDISDLALYLSNFGHALPEQGDVSSKSDILSLGATVYFLLTGTQLPAAAGNIEELLTLNSNLAKEDIPSTASFLQSLLVPDPTQRPSAYDIFRNSWSWLQ
ncbi:hypothetical protein M413DRAFT_11193 [Hebeloma cylindrosporum]|uniref:non-specific serine/threonine protein kinase n=1 Tax=Hebeloma cylindrosporum TaxID=76867 RepID=A0A0C2YIJ6_HEBCY|nr:hypothetical protein M413DRAFT_11193 [Hebeloma cylindrosporum h7]